jgi:hypothetical protein
MAEETWTFATPVQVEIAQDHGHDGLLDAVSPFGRHLGVILTGGDGYVIAPAAQVRRR